MRSIAENNGAQRGFDLSGFILAVVIPTVGAVFGIITGAIQAYQALRPPARRRLSYRVHLDGGIGSIPEIRGLAELVVRRRSNGSTRDVPNASMAMIRMSNDSLADIRPADYDPSDPITFTFGDRKVVDVLVEVDDEENFAAVRDRITEGLDFQREGSGDNWLRLPAIRLKRGIRFRMVVLLEGNEPGVTVSGTTDGNALFAEPRMIGPNRATRRAIGFGSVAVASLLALVLVLVFLTPARPAVPCVRGTITVTGSTAFGQTAANDLSAQYQRSCSASKIGVMPDDSSEGVSSLAITTDPTMRATDIAMSDGPQPQYHQLIGQQVAVIIFSVVVNKQTGVSSLTTDDLRGIYSGRITNWRQLGGPDIPITIVGRVGGSGTRDTFDHKILGAVPEPPANSSDCLNPATTPASPVTKCEMNSTPDLLTHVNAIRGAIGYAELSVASAAQSSKYPNIDQVQLDSFNPDSASVESNDYPFWTVEYAYTYGKPDMKSLEFAFLSYLGQDAGRTILQNDDYIPCMDQGAIIPLCK